MMLSKIKYIVIIVIVVIVSFYFYYEINKIKKMFIPIYSTVFSLDAKYHQQEKKCNNLNELKSFTDTSPIMSITYHSPHGDPKLSAKYENLTQSDTKKIDSIFQKPGSAEIPKFLKVQEEKSNKDCKISKIKVDDFSESDSVNLSDKNSKNLSDEKENSFLEYKCILNNLSDQKENFNHDINLKVAQEISDKIKI
jgi:hypothetical protein